MKLALLIAWLLVGVVDSDWLWTEASDADSTADVSKMDGGEPPPPKP